MPSPAVIAAAQRNRSRLGPYLIKHGKDCPTVSYVVANTSTVAALPFDGFVVAPNGTNNSQETVISTTATSLAQCQGDLTGLSGAIASFGGNKRVLPRIVYTTTTIPDYFNDTHWTTISGNFANFAQACLGAGAWGVCFDPEFYPPTGTSYTGPNLWDWGNNSNLWADGANGDSGSINPTSTPAAGATPGVALAPARTKVQARGKQVMDAVLAVWPTCKMLSLHGPSDSSYLTSGAFNPPSYNNIAFANELLGAFVGGMAESIRANGGKGVLYDGGQIYGARTKTDFRIVNSWRKQGLLDSATTAFDANAKRALKLKAVNAVGIEDLDITSGLAPLARDTFVNMCRDAMLMGNDLVWTYTEQHDWFGTGFPATPVPSDWKTAMSAARDAGRL